MAIYHMSAQVISRSAGRSATAAAAYRAGEKIIDERTGQVNDYTKKQGVDYQEILTPVYVGEWAKNRATLWNAAEQVESRKNSQIAREVNIAIPIELSSEQGRKLVREYAQKNFVDQGMIADICIHGENTNNPHAHIMLSMREAGQDGFTTKNRNWNAKEQLEKWREEWAYSCNHALDRAGELARVDHRSLSAQGVNRAATVHQGPAATEIERKGGESWVCGINADIQKLNHANREIEEIENAIESLRKELGSIKVERTGRFSANNLVKTDLVKNAQKRLERIEKEEAFLREVKEALLTPEEKKEIEDKKIQEIEAKKIQDSPEEIINSEAKKYGLSLNSTIEDVKISFYERMTFANADYAKEQNILESNKIDITQDKFALKEEEILGRQKYLGSCIDSAENFRDSAIRMRQKLDGLGGIFQGSEKKRLDAMIIEREKGVENAKADFLEYIYETAEPYRRNLDIYTRHKADFEQSEEYRFFHEKIKPEQENKERLRLLREKHEKIFTQRERSREKLQNDRKERGGLER